MRNFKFIASWKLCGVLSFSWTDEQTGNTRKVPVKSTREADKTFGSRDGVTTPTFVAVLPMKQASPYSANFIGSNS
jgi:hypothetical protein